MTLPEYLSWIEFYKLYPFDDFHRYHRPAALVAQSLGGEDADVVAMLEWLQPDSNVGRPVPKAAAVTPVHQYGAADMNTFKAFGFKPPAPRRTH